MDHYEKRQGPKSYKIEEEPNLHVLVARIQDSFDFKDDLSSLIEELSEIQTYSTKQN